MRIVKGQEVTLVPLTRKGKNRIHEHGERWRVEGIRNRVGFSLRPGPWVLVVAVNDPNLFEGQPTFRWVRELDDENFEIDTTSAGSQAA